MTNVKKRINNGILNNGLFDPFIVKGSLGRPVLDLDIFSPSLTRKQITEGK